MKRLFILSIIVIQGIFLYAKPIEEVLNFTMRYGFIKGGKVTITAKSSTFENKPAVYLNMRGRTVGLTGSFYEVDNTYECYVSEDEYLPLKAKITINEQEHHLKNEVWFYNDEGKIKCQNTGKEIACPDEIEL